MDYYNSYKKYKSKYKSMLSGSPTPLTHHYKIGDWITIPNGEKRTYLTGHDPTYRRGDWSGFGVFEITSKTCIGALYPELIGKLALSGGTEAADYIGPTGGAAYREVFIISGLDYYGSPGTYKEIRDNYRQLVIIRNDQPSEDESSTHTSDATECRKNFWASDMEKSRHASVMKEIFRNDFNKPIFKTRGFENSHITPHSLPFL
jgi:hypothetical protein